MIEAVLVLERIEAAVFPPRFRGVSMLSAFFLYIGFTSLIALSFRSYPDSIASRHCSWLDYFCTVDILSCERVDRGISGDWHTLRIRGAFPLCLVYKYTSVTLFVRDVIAGHGAGELRSRTVSSSLLWSPLRSCWGERGLGASN